MKGEEPDRSKVVTILSSKKQITPFVRKRSLIKHWMHFDAWCKLRKYDPQDKYTQDYYIDNVLDDNENLYWAEKHTWNRKTFASYLRILNVCVPAGLPWENKVEFDSAKEVYDIIKEEQAKNSK